MTGIAFLLIGLGLGAGAVYVWARGRLENAARELQRADGIEDRLKAATGDVILKSQSSLLDLTEAKLAPIKETLTKFEAHARELEAKRAREVTAIGERLREVAEGQEKLRTETGSLVTALGPPNGGGRGGGW